MPAKAGRPQVKWGILAMEQPHALAGPGRQDHLVRIKAWQLEEGGLWNAHGWMSGALPGAAQEVRTAPCMLRCAKAQAHLWLAQVWDGCWGHLCLRKGRGGAWGPSRQAMGVQGILGQHGWLGRHHHHGPTGWLGILRALIKGCHAIDAKPQVWDVELLLVSMAP